MSTSGRPATVLFSLITALAAATSSLADTPDCPYPCLPPPTSGGIINSYPPPPPAATGGSGNDGFGGSYPPPPPGAFGQLTPPGVMPGTFLAPPYSAVPAGPAPPPPNPVLPWYPWYYQHNNPITGSSTSSAPAVHRRATSVGALLLQMYCALVILLRAL
ncbi:formin-like protein 3 [Brachypodium distachyon]|uniref:Uncharacterized protein n=1 Tax=Brachypodium distachyon TaxID=15368 RepID=I1IPF6_BRADI|nr:formin-like protein 3 [Brachypodium distachyon]KQJ89874.1 hypothetical protein BRADI_4g28260v3 [Brachypodium distachyon]|eukprot:XP_003576429.1 formin-like protein 3 [Brachypodium distachyon]